MTVDRLRREISVFLKFRPSETDVPFETQGTTDAGSYERLRIRYSAEEGDHIPAFLLLPEGPGPFAAVLVHHQHHGQRHLGKSEVCGLVGDRLQAFGPALARRGLVVLTADSICFEDRRANRSGTAASLTPAKQVVTSKHKGNRRCANRRPFRFTSDNVAISRL